MRLRVEVAAGDAMPRGYGMAYYIPGRDACVAMPVGLNLIVCWARAAYRWLRFPPGRMVGARQLYEARQRAYDEGYQAAAKRYGGDA
jgi:hypothetical protein